MLNYSGSSEQDRNKTLKVHSAQIIDAFAERSVIDMRRGKLIVAVVIVIIIIIISILFLSLLYDMDVSCHRSFLPGTSLEPAVIPTAQASSFTLQYLPYYV